ncbi:MAG: hypothetical protein WAL90_00210 [Desulfobacterales bacterium]
MEWWKMIIFRYLPGKITTAIAGVKFAARTESDIQMIEVFLQTTSAISFRYIKRYAVRRSMLLEASLLSSNGISKYFTG